ncbi:enoyl-CoA hydratase/carnithine racemase [Mesorhizobium sp. J18]|uniref:enoyl-CoA hydratase/isomerase family protein n=1 Tax=Mesorhizobium sp. J18 TaxID=935263 RepID=UPI00119A6E7C|nr:enoyl-CoA hydratase-related protein [Mesorhizobium sp. J18]TWG93804.1 enoyl-CoA hydratase/carnithine racemase [Mesorhizobium sp. J18]
MPKALYEKKGRIAYVTFNRPEAMNAIDLEMHEQLWEIWRDFRDDDAVEVAILTGAGDEAFCAGADLKTHLPYWVANADALLPRRKIRDGLGGITRGLHRIYKPIIAAVNGWALAGGFENALACDIRIASERAQFGSFEVRRGFHHGDGGIVRLVNICGSGIALEMLLTGEPIDAERALRCNMVSKVVPHGKLMEEAEKVARQILRNDQWAVRSAKETILNVIGRPLEDQLAYEAMTGYSGAANPPVRERLSEFYEKSDTGRAGRNGTPL